MTRYRFLAAVLTLASLSHAGAATFSVLNTLDSGSGSLRQAIVNANNAAGDDIITFDIAGSGRHTIQLANALPNLTSNITFLNDRAGDERVALRPANAPFALLKINAGQTVTVAGLDFYFGSPGIVNEGGALTVRNCTLFGNTGGLSNLAYDGQTATLVMVNCTVFANRRGFGGGLLNASTFSASQANATLTNCTFYSNESDSPQGGGAAIDNGGGGATVLLVNCTLTANKNAPSGATLYTGSAATSRAINTIFETSSGVTINSPYGTFISLGHNLSNQTEGGDTGTGPGGFLGASGDKRNSNPMLGSMTNNGGLTETRAITASSPAFEAGDDAVLNSPYNLTTDQHGIARKTGAHVDIGAYESELEQSGSIFTVNTLVEADDGTCGALHCTLQEAINAANLFPDANTITFPPNFSGIYVNRVRAGLTISNPLTIIGSGTNRLSIFGSAWEAAADSARPDGAEYDSRIFRIASGAGSVALSDMTLAYGRAVGPSPDNTGGAIHNSASLTLTRCSIQGNHASLFAGAIYNDGNGRTASLTMVDCLLTGNTSGASGGAILTAGYNGGNATATLTNTTVSNNAALNGAGTIYNDGNLNGNATLTLTNCTFAGNTATFAASAVYNDALNPDSSGTATLNVRNTIFKVTNAATGQKNLYNDGGTIASQGHNLSNDNSGGDGGTGPGGYLTGPGDMRNTDPMLGSLGNNGGPTSTLPLLAGSPARDAGDNAFAPPRDQRSYYRSGPSDIGAFEFNGTVGPITAVSRKVHTNVGSFDIPLPLTGAAGIESRNIGTGYQIVLTFPRNVSATGASVAEGTATLGTVTGHGTNTLIINITSAPSPQVIAITLHGVNDGISTGDVPIRMGVLVGDSNGDKNVNSGDATQTKARSGQTTGTTNFRSDYNCDGTINSGDATVVRSRSGQSIP